LKKGFFLWLHVEVSAFKCWIGQHLIFFSQILLLLAEVDILLVVYLVGKRAVENVTNKYSKAFAMFLGLLHYLR